METTEQVQTLKKIIEVINAEDIDVSYCSYSGRGMMGDYCVGVKADIYDTDTLTTLLEENSIGFTTDSLGMGMIIYFKYLDYDTVSAYVPEDEE